MLPVLCHHQLLSTVSPSHKMCQTNVECPFCGALFASIGWRRDGQHVTFSCPADTYPKGTKPYDLPGALRRRKFTHLSNKHDRDAHDKTLSRSEVLKVKSTIMSTRWKATGVSKEDLDEAKKKRRREQQKIYRARHKSKKRIQMCTEKVRGQPCAPASRV